PGRDRTPRGARSRRDRPSSGGDRRRRGHGRARAPLPHPEARRFEEPARPRAPPRRPLRPADAGLPPRPRPTARVQRGGLHDACRSRARHVSQGRHLGWCPREARGPGALQRLRGMEGADAGTLSLMLALLLLLLASGPAGADDLLAEAAATEQAADDVVHGLLTHALLGSVDGVAEDVTRVRTLDAARRAAGLPASGPL